MTCLTGLKPIKNLHIHTKSFVFHEEKLLCGNFILEIKESQKINFGETIKVKEKREWT